MRPLSHLGTGVGSPDLDLYERDEALYDELMHRGNEIVEKAFSDHMGPYLEEPKETKQQLEMRLENRLKRLKNMKRLGIPDHENTSVISENEERLINELYERIQKKDWAKKGDVREKKYRQNRESRLSEWRNSKKVQKMYDEIFAYNEKKYRELLEREEAVS